jgi:polygalacturonase
MESGEVTRQGAGPGVRCGQFLIGGSGKLFRKKCDRFGAECQPVRQEKTLARANSPSARSLRCPYLGARLKLMRLQNLCIALVLVFVCWPLSFLAGQPVSVPADEQQLPHSMHSQMKERPVITVGLKDADLVGSDNRVLQAALDYIAGLGGGVVEIEPGEFVMHDSLHLRSFVRVRGTKDKTILRKADGVVSPLALDGDYGEEQVTLVSPAGFKAGYGITIWDSQSGGFHTTVGRITGQNGNTFSFDAPLNADCLVANKAMAATVFPVVSGCFVEGVVVEDLIIDGNKEQNVALNGCRGGGIFLYRGFGTVIRGCRVRNFNGDGISFQQSNDVVVENCVSEGNSGLGMHPGSGSQRPVVRSCVARNNGEDGLFLCWRVRHGLFEKNLLENNGRYGISIGHKDTDNLLQDNEVRGNHQDGVFFRDETEGMAGHRNRLEKNLIENNGEQHEAAGIRVRGETHDLVFRQNIIRDTRPPKARKQVVGIRIEEGVGNLSLEDNQIQADTNIEDQRKLKVASP